MQIVELGDYSMVIMKDSEDPPWISVGDVYREAQSRNSHIKVEFKTPYYSLEPIRESISQLSSEAIYSGGRLVLFFKDPVDPRFHLRDTVYLF